MEKKYLGMEKNIAFGADFDGCTVNAELDGLESVKPLYDYLLTEKIDENILNNIFFDNANRFLIANI